MTQPQHQYSKTATYIVNCVYIYIHIIYRVSNLKCESVRIDSKTVVFIRANPGKKETTDGWGSHVNFIQKQCTFLEVVSPEKWYVTNIKPWA